MAEESHISLLPFLLLFGAFIHSTNGGCPMPTKKLLHGRYIYKNPSDFNLTEVPENYVLQFRCYKGYEMTAPQMILCQNSQWSDHQPKCIKLFCRRPPAIKNGFYFLQKGVTHYPTIGAIANYSCNDDFVIVNQSSFLTCTWENSKAVWKGEIPNCLEKEICPDPGVSLNGSRNGDCCYIGNHVKYACKKGFELEGKNSIHCLPGGKWSDPRPLCRPLSGFCPEPPEIPNGVVRGNKKGDFYVPRDEVEIVCNPGYVYHGEIDYIYCETDLEWEEEFGECHESFCKLPELPENGSIIELKSTNSTEFPYKFELSYICNPGFRLIGENFRFCDKDDWSGTAPYCEAIDCPNPGVPEHGTRLGVNFTAGEKVVFHCNTGFNLIGSVERYCLLNGRWSGELARCNTKSNYCPDPGVPTNGMKLGNRYDVKEKVEFRCHPGFSLIGSAERECLPNRTWSGIEATCLGAYDFDNNQDVSYILKTVVGEKAEEQKAELSKLNTSRVTGRIIDINYPGRLILYFVFDVSGSVRINNFQTSIKFAKALVKKIGITKNGARAGALTFSSKSEIQFLPMHFETTEAVLDALDQIEYTAGGTATNSALEKIRIGMIPLATEKFGRQNVKSIIIILTDGKANTGGDPEEEAKLLKDSGVEIYCIGITGNFKKDTLYKIASEPKPAEPFNKYVFILNSYDTMNWLVQEITNGTIDYSQCGVGMEKVGRKQRSRIFQGETAVDPWPWMAALYFISYDGNVPMEAELQCGASIINQQWILTAAHCLYIKDTPILRDTKDIIVKLGLTDVKNQSSLQEFEVHKYFIHTKYDNMKSFDYDVALILLNGMIEFNPYVRPVCLPPTELPADTRLYKTKENAFATGWGHTERVEIGEKVSVKTTRVLKEILLPLQKRELCEKSLQNIDDKSSKLLFTKRMFCAGSGQGDGDTCHGDSGGPVMQSQIDKEGNVYWTVIGLVSWGTGCGVENTYGYYTRVHSVLPWIQSTLNAPIEE